MTDIANEVVAKIRRNRISTSEISDCLGKTGVIRGVDALNSRHFRVGPVRFVYAWDESNWELHDQVQHVLPGEVVICHAINCGDYALFGALVAKFMLLYREVAAVVVCGLVRDAHTLKMENYPIWCEGTTPLGCFNRKNDKLPDAELLAALQARYEGAIAVCDDSGVVIIPPNRVNEDLLTELDFIELQEDAWFHCIDSGYTTYDAVCLKRYLEEESLLSSYSRLKQRN